LTYESEQPPELLKAGNRSICEDEMKTGTSTYHIPYSETEIEFNLPSGMRGSVVTSKQAQPLA
jgi:hypothetical protein